MPTPSESDKALRISEARYRRLFESAQDGILLLNAETAEIEDANPFLKNILGYSHKELLGKKIWEIGAFKDTLLNKEAFIELQTNRFIRYDDLPLVAKNGACISVEFVSNVYDCEGTKVIQCNIRDNTKRHLAEIALRATTRSLKMISESNIALLKSDTEMILLTEYCRIAVESGGYLLAWVGLTEDHDDKNVKVISQFGQDDGYLELCKITTSKDDFSNSLTGRAIHSQKIEFSDNIATDLKMTHCQKEASKRGFKSAIALPFQLPNNKTACLTLYSSKLDIWSPTEHSLLAEKHKTFPLDSLL
ncbi:hypothetical protein CYQ88_04845 [Hydrogenovibrio sp. SC-1]|nr:hypothetical protein CYQ88_04845 [Hydrogenovibrio sp. SC-1]